MTHRQRPLWPDGRPRPLGGELASPLTLVLSVAVFLAVAFLAVRFMYGLGAVTNINNGYPWGIWIVYDVVIITGFACGGYAMALVTYILNRGEFHPLVRPALGAAVFGYSMGGLSVLIDLGRYWNFWHILSPSYFNTGSVLFEVAACISLYCVVLWIEFSPLFLKGELKRKVSKGMFFFIGLGVLLPSMHQSSMGSLLVVFGYQIHPLWQTMLLPLLFLLTAVTMGFSVVIFEATTGAIYFHRDLKAEIPILAKLGAIIAGLLVVFLVVRFIDLAARGALGLILTSGVKSVMFLIETALFALPIWLLRSHAQRRRLSRLFPAACLMLAGSVVYRLDAFLVAYDTGPGWHYFPSVPEILVTFGMVCLEVLIYIALVRKFPILPGGHTASAR